MNYRSPIGYPISILLLLIGCTSSLEEQFPNANFEEEKAAILETLNNETKSAFQRDYELWASHWIHGANISKTYINFADSSYSESIGWKKVSGFIKTFFEQHPEPEPVPEALADIDVRLYGNGAWVTYEQMDSIRGLKRETRLMEKVEGKWKIAGMHTTIYGFGSE